LITHSHKSSRNQGAGRFLEDELRVVATGNKAMMNENKRLNIRDTGGNVSDLRNWCNKEEASRNSSGVSICTFVQTQVN
jgi:hypothetical protein